MYAIRSYYAHGTVFGEQGLDGILGGVMWQVANKHFLHVRVLAAGDGVSPGQKKEPRCCAGFLVQFGSETRSALNRDFGRLQSLGSFLDFEAH